MFITKRMITLFYVVMLCMSLHAHDKKATSVFILIHGTWGADCDWYKPQGDFFDALETTVSEKNSIVISFKWSGGCGHEARVKAAHELVNVIKEYDEDVAIFLVAHSHGGNVGALASQLLAQDVENNHTIRALFTLGTPIMSNYLPNMHIIHYVYNLFSFEDIVQTVLGISQREYPQHKRIANLRVIINNKQPDHKDMHHVLIGKWLAYIHQYFKRYLQEKGIENRISEPTILYLDGDALPRYVHDDAREDLRERDRQFSVLLLNSLRNSLDTGSNMPLTNR
jgi:hypothetical protein